MIHLQSGHAAATWPGTRLGARRVLAPEDVRGELQGPREHGRLHVAARWPDDDRPLPPGVASYRRTTLEELCARLPADATLGIGPQGDPISCDVAGLARFPRALDLGRRHRQVVVTRVPEDHPFDSVARHQGAAAAYSLIDRSEPAVLLVAVRSTDTTHERTTRAFADDCQLSGIADPAQLWERDDLPRWFRKLLETADEETP